MLEVLDGAGSFDEFYRAEYGRVLALAVALCGDRAAAEDLVQDGFLAAHRKWDRVAAYDAPGAFVRRVVLNRAATRRRRRAREAAALARLAARTPVGVSADASVDAVTDEDFWAVVRALPPMQARCVVLRYVDDLDAASIASVLGCAEPTVRVHLHRARLTLAARLRLDVD
jgi:RNA polymerase sigma-70 factor (ECF subfamily)